MVSTKAVKSFLSEITVEPLIIINMIGVQIFGVAMSIGVYHVICEQLYVNDTSVNCANTDQLSKDVEDRVQIATADYQLVQSLCYLVPAIFADILMSAWSDKHGRKVCLLISIAGSVVLCLPYTVIFSYPQTSLVILLIGNAIAGATGAIGMIMVACTAYLADQVHDKSKLATRLIIFSTCQMFAQVIGNFVATQLSKVTSYNGLIVADAVLQTISFFYALFRLRHAPPEQHLIGPSQNDAKDKTIQNPDAKKSTSLQSCISPVLNTVKDTWALLVSVWKTFSKRRSNSKRTNLWFMTLVMFFAVFGYLGVIVYALGLFVQRRPLYWNDTTYAKFQTFLSIVNVFGNIFGAIMIKRVFKLREASMLALGLISASGSLVIFAFADVAWLMYLAASVGLLNGLVVPAASSIINQQVERDEIGKAYAGYGLSSDVALVLSSVMITSVYSSTVDWFPGFVFFVGTAILCVCVIATIWVWWHGGDKYIE